MIFQSTLPARGATWLMVSIVAVVSDFNPRSPHGERPASLAALIKAEREFQSTLPARGATVSYSAHSFAISTFQSTLPARGATDTPDSAKMYPADFNPRSPHGERQTVLMQRRVVFEISIHAPRTGSDIRCYPHTPLIWQFQSTLPARGATGKEPSRYTDGVFQSTLPARGATYPERMKG